ncbi:SDR family NAD(P)-dependent oxidoreductase [Actibacterium lipolyticum]|uniref:3-oxoacyl-[acyl-carrier-protein] reductase FabG n=1 Tax=Actibacterium lipolyticum TaxID=1524263 RepID=A0A238JPT9_9RHOB|nr:SDR family NAD(P)-dependent oxidoreductase [Actibacterium lipolyticum]SMX32214.1 3-oxoacyl-[acyl-carrier-protein] reductase FabG [Actibacterium lipolyticum]
MEINTSRVAIVTGGASGLGAAVAKELSSAGAKVTIFDMNAEQGAAMAESIGGAFQQVDVSDPASVASGVAAVKDAQGGINILVNCAGIGPAAKTVSRGEAHDPAMFDKTIRVNLIGTFNCASQVAAVMAEGDPVTADGERGVIVNTASVAAYDGQVGQVAYAASKGGIVGMTLPMARDLSQIGIRVCTIAPGIFMTPLLAGLPEEVQTSLGQQVPFPSRLGDPGEFASLARHIVENAMLNGEVIRLDGAIRMAPR